MKRVCNRMLDHGFDAMFADELKLAFQVAVKRTASWVSFCNEAPGALARTYTVTGLNGRGAHSSLIARLRRSLNQ